MAEFRIAEDVVAQENDKRDKALKEDYAALGANLARRGIDIDAMVRHPVRQYQVAG